MVALEYYDENDLKYKAQNEFVCKQQKHANEMLIFSVGCFEFLGQRDYFKLSMLLLNHAKIPTVYLTQPYKI